MTYSSFINEFCQILKLAKPDDSLPTDQSVVAEKIRIFLGSSAKDWLLVLDDADGLNDFVFVEDLRNEQSIK